MSVVSVFGFFFKKNKTQKSTKGIRDGEILRTSAWQVWTVTKNKAGRERNGCLYCGEKESVQTLQAESLPSQICKAESMSVWISVR